MGAALLVVQLPGAYRPGASLSTPRTKKNEQPPINVGDPSASDAATAVARNFRTARRPPLTDARQGIRFQDGRNVFESVGGPSERT